MYEEYHRYRVICNRCDKTTLNMPTKQGAYEQAKTEGWTQVSIEVHYCSQCDKRRPNPAPGN